MVPAVQAVLSRRADVHCRGGGAEMRSADLVVVVVDGDEPDAVHAVAEVRAETDRPVVVVTGPRPDRFDVFDAGADDVVAAPIDPEELTARVAVRLARAPHDGDQLHHGPLLVDRLRRVVTLDDEVVHLTAREFDLLEHLARHPGVVYRRGELLDAVWRSSVEWQQARTVTEHVHRLRRKLGDRWVVTVHGVGYRFDPTAAVSESYA